MPTENNTNSARLNVEILEARTVPATLGARHGESIAVGDVIPGDGNYEYITGTGPGRQALVRVFDRNGNLKYKVHPFGAYSGGVFVAVGDVNFDGNLEIICSTAGGTTGRVRTYEFKNNQLRPEADFRPFGANYVGGVQLTAGNVTGDRTQEIIVGKMEGGSQVKVFAAAPGSGGTKFFNTRTFDAFESTYKGGVTLSAANIDQTVNTVGDPYNYDYAEIIVGKLRQAPLLSIFDAQQPTVTTRASYFAFDPNLAGLANTGIDVTAGSTDGVRGAEIYVTLRNSNLIRVFNGQTGVAFSFNGINDISVPYPIEYARNLNLAIYNLDDDVVGLNQVTNLFVVGADGPYEQTPIVYPGAVNIPAGFNGSHAAP